jgi:hypothetical protein
VNNQIQIVKSFIEDSFLATEEIVANYNSAPRLFAAERVAEIADVTGETVTESDIHAAMAEFGGIQYDLQSGKQFGVQGLMLIRLVDNATAIFTGEKVNELAAEWVQCGKDINALGNMYATLLNPAITGAQA